MTTYLSTLLMHLGLDEGLGLALSLVLGAAVLGLIVVLIWIDRDWIGQMILEGAADSAQPPSRFLQALAANWHIPASFMIVFLWVLAIGTRVLTGERTAAPVILSLGVIVGVPLVNWLVKVAVSALLKVQATNALPIAEAAVGQETGAEAEDAEQ